MANKQNSHLRLHLLIGFFGTLLLILLIALFSKSFYPDIAGDYKEERPLLSEIIQIEVLNGCGVPGIASRFTSYLRAAGFDVVESGNFQSFSITQTLVIDRSGNLDNARKIARALGVSEEQIIREISRDYYLDATVIIGSDFESLKP